METSGEVLKHKLKLDNFPNIKIRRCIAGGGLPIYQIVYNSRSPSMPLSAYRLNNDVLTPKVVASDDLYYTPWINLGNFLGNTRTKIFVVTDLAGIYGRRSSYSESTDSTDPKLVMQLPSNYLNEWITLPALMDKQANLTSVLTKGYKDIRKQVQKTANINTKLITTTRQGNNVRFSFLTEATEMYEPDHKFGQVNFTTKTIEPNPSKTYEIWIEFVDVLGDNGWINAFDLEKEVLTQKDIKDLIKSANVQVWDNNPSFQYQGFNWAMTALDASLSPETRAPKVWGPKHGGAGNALLSKHLSQLVDSLPFFIPQMASALTNLLRKEGIMKAYSKKN